MTEKILVPNQEDVLRSFGNARFEAAVNDSLSNHPESENLYRTYAATRDDIEHGLRHKRVEHLGRPGDVHQVSVFDHGKRIDAKIKTADREISTHRLGDRHITVMKVRRDGKQKTYMSETPLAHNLAASVAIAGTGLFESTLNEIKNLPESHGRNN